MTAALRSRLDADASLSVGATDKQRSTTAEVA